MDYMNYRWFYTINNKLVIGGKNKEQNEVVIKNFLRPDYVVAHTSAHGSPFMIIQFSNPSNQDIKEAAVFCACFSKEWKNLKSKNNKIAVDVFRGGQIYKTKTMKTGTFGVKGNKKTLNVKPELALLIQKGKLRAVPKISKIERTSFIEIKPGELSKEQAVEKILRIIKNKSNLKISKEEIMQVIPSDSLDVKVI
ncbi:MAG: NFACT RNA binding domain-containing protein [Nanoarchaeota archaeon]